MLGSNSNTAFSKIFLRHFYCCNCCTVHGAMLVLLYLTNQSTRHYSTWTFRLKQQYWSRPSTLHAWLGPQRIFSVPFDWRACMNSTGFTRLRWSKQKHRKCRISSHHTTSRTHLKRQSHWPPCGGRLCRGWWCPIGSSKLKQQIMIRKIWNELWGNI